MYITFYKRIILDYCSKKRKIRNTYISYIELWFSYSVNNRQKRCHAQKKGKQRVELECIYCLAYYWPPKFSSKGCTCRSLGCGSIKIGWSVRVSCHLCHLYQKITCALQPPACAAAFSSWQGESRSSHAFWCDFWHENGDQLRCLSAPALVQWKEFPCDLLVKKMYTLILWESMSLAIKIHNARRLSISYIYIYIYIIYIFVFFWYLSVTHTSEHS